jgi:cell division FtsZ-interacting protein ZapD
MDPDSIEAEYDRLRQELKRLLRAPERDMRAVEQVLEQLDAAHMRFKEAHGLHGNNPIE